MRAEQLPAFQSDTRGEGVPRELEASFENYIQALKSIRDS